MPFLSDLWNHRRIIRELRAHVEALETALAGAPPIERALMPNAEPDVVLKPLRVGRRSYAEEQQAWEWAHNSRARELAARAKDGFF